MPNIRVEGNAGTNVAETTATNELLVKFPLTPASVGAVRVYTQKDSDRYNLSAPLRHPQTSPDFKLRSGMDTLLFNDSFNTATQNTALWKCVFVVMTVTEGVGSLLFNANSNVAAANGVALSTWRYFPLIQRCPTYVEFSGYPSFSGASTNQVFEFGLFAPTTGIVAPTDGVFWRHTSAGLTGVMCYNGIELFTGIIAQPTYMSQSSYLMTVGENQVRFWIDDKLVGTILIPPSLGTPFMSYSRPLAMQFRNVAAVTGSPVLQWRMCNVSVGLADWGTSKPWGNQMSGMGLTAAHGQNGHANYISTALAVTGAPAAAAVPANATAAAQFLGLGGFSQMTTTLAANTEAIINSYQNPVGTVNLTGRTLMITGVRIQAAVSTVLGGGPLILVYQLGYGASAISMAVAADSTSFATATAKCFRRIPIGIMTFPNLAAVGVAGADGGIFLDLKEAPIAINPGEYVNIGVRNQGASVSGALLHSITYTGYWE